MIGFALSEKTKNTPVAPKGELAIRVLAMPANTNQNGDIFGGWLLGQMDMGGEVTVTKLSKGRCVTVAVDAMNDPRAYMTGRRMIERGDSPLLDALADTSFPLKSLPLAELATI